MLNPITIKTRAVGMAAVGMALFLLPSLSLGREFSSSALRSQIDQILREAYPENEPGVAAIVVDGGKTILRSGYGLADLEHGITIEPDMVFRLGSMTKQFTAVAVMILAEEGKLSLDDDFTQHLPDYPRPKTRDGVETRVTIEHLLTHTSGIPSYTAKPELMARVYEPYTVDAMLAVFKDEALEFEPGSKWDYNNSGYFLLGALIEEVSGRSYADFVHERIFKPLGMNQTYYGEHERVIARRARGYHRDGDAYVNAPYIDMSIPYAGGSLLSTVDDLATWNRALGTDELLPRPVPERMWTDYALANGEASGYGYGWFVGDHEGIPVVFHAGGIHGFASIGIRLPSRDAHLALLTNNPQNGQALAFLAQRIASLLIGDVAPVAVETAPAALRRFVGVYRVDESDGYTVTLKQGQLHVQETNRGKIPVRFSSETEFFYDSRPTRGRFELDEAGEVRGMRLKPWAQPGRFAVRTARPVPEEPQVVAVDPALFDDYAGKYDFMSRFYITVHRDGDRLMAEAMGQPAFQLLPISETEFFGEAVGGRITFVRDGENGIVTGFVVRQGEQETTAKRVE